MLAADLLRLPGRVCRGGRRVSARSRGAEAQHASGIARDHSRDRPRRRTGDLVPRSRLPRRRLDGRGLCRVQGSPELPAVQRLGPRTASRRAQGLHDDEERPPLPRRPSAPEDARKEADRGAPSGALTELALAGAAAPDGVDRLAAPPFRFALPRGSCLVRSSCERLAFGVAIMLVRSARWSGWHSASAAARPSVTGFV